MVLTQQNPGKTSALTDSQLSGFFADELYSLFRAEKHLKLASEKWQEAANTEPLKDLIGEYIHLLHRQSFRLEEIFSILLLPHPTGYCEAMEGIIKELESKISNTNSRTTTRDAALIVAIQKALHYKIASYGSLAQLATTLGMEDVSNLLNQALKEEKEYDQLFTEIADKRINWLAETE